MGGWQQGAASVCAPLGSEAATAVGAQSPGFGAQGPFCAPGTHPSCVRAAPGTRDGLGQGLGDGGFGKL